MSEPKEANDLVICLFFFSNNFHFKLKIYAVVLFRLQL